MMTIRNYVRARSLEEAYDLLQKNKRSRIVGGMLWMRLNSVPVSTAIDLSDLGLDTIEETADSFSIGAMVSLRQLELHPGLNAYTNGAMAQAVRDIVGVQFRNLATVGGSLYGRFGFSDVLTMFLAMDVQVALYKEGLVPLAEFARRSKKERDILVRVIVKKRPGSFAYEAMRNARTDFPVLTCAVSTLEGQTRAVIGARPGRAVVVENGEHLAAADFAAFVARQAPTGSNVRASAEYRTHLVRVLVKRALGGMEHGN